ncbi:MAG TPA: aminopeptidase [Thermotogae bacterium]|nr:aminopeptidase [Thermotogota bacterium]
MSSVEFNPKNVWTVRRREEIENYIDGYKNFMSECKTVRESIEYFARMLEEKGFKRLSNLPSRGRPPKNLDVYEVYKNKMLVAFRIRSPLSRGINLIGAHIDSPRLDLKPLPVVEKEGFAIGKTHYYGGIKKYQWFNLPLAVHGTVVRTDGSTVEVKIGEDPSEPVLVIADLLPHLDRRDEPVSKLFKGEDLNVLLASDTVGQKEEKNVVKKKLLELLNEKYGITEEDLVSAEIEIVPALQPKDVGIDGSMIGAYGHDDRVCAYTAVTALLEANNPSRSAGVVLLDREEIGSDGNTGAKHHFWLKVLKKLAQVVREDIDIDDLMELSGMISGDVSAGLNPTFTDVHDPSNAPRLNYGIAILRYTGSGGKYSTNESHAEFIAALRKIFNESGVCWQPAELGKVDQGGGGTVAKFFAETGIDVVDAGPPLLGMHSPFEIASKADVYETYRAYRVFLERFGT